MSASTRLPPDALLERIARSLKEDIAPSVEAAYPKTQAFMASVVLKKLAAEIRLADAHAAQNRTETASLARDLEATLAEDGRTPAPLATALAQLREDLDAAGLTRTIEALYATRQELGEARFEALLARVRSLLRARIDRALAYSA